LFLFGRGNNKKLRINLDIFLFVWTIKTK